MRLCLTCRYLADGDALFCPHCARSFGGKRCPRGHLSPPTAVCCQACGRTDLSEATGSIRLGPALRLVLLGLGFSAAVAAARSLSPALAATCGPALREAVHVAVIAAIVLYLVPGRIGRDLRRGAGLLLRSLWRTLLGLQLLRVALRLLRRFTDTRSGGSRPWR